MLSQRFELTRVKPLEETGDAKYCRMADMWKGTCLKNEMKLCLGVCMPWQLEHMCWCFFLLIIEQEDANVMTLHNMQNKTNIKLLLLWLPGILTQQILNTQLIC